MEIIRSIQNRIYIIRGERIMLDRDLGNLYHVETKRLTEAVKRNIERFPKDFMFQLTKEEFDDLKYEAQLNDLKPLHLDTTKASDHSLRSQIATLKNGRGKHAKYLPYAFTEQGVAMLSSVLHSKDAISMNISIMRAFVEIRRAIIKESLFTAELSDLQKRIGEHDIQLSQIYEAIENIMDENVAKKKWDERERIGFKK